MLGPLVGPALVPRAFPVLPVGEMLQLEDVHGLRVAGGAEELRVHAESQGADGHVPGDTATGGG